MRRLIGAGRITAVGRYLRYKMYSDDYPVVRVTNLWNDVRAGSYGEAKIYVVQTNVHVIPRCILMATDPGDLVLDPTCGSGTTGYVAEYWGRRWITMDTSRVAFALARQRLMTAKFDYFDLRPLNDEDRRRNPNGPWLKDEKVPEGTQRAGAGGTATEGATDTTGAKDAAKREPK